MNIKDWLLYEDDVLIAFNKPALLPTQPDLTGDESLLDLAKHYVKKPIHLLHRLDRPTSGIVLFAKNEKIAALLNQQFQQRTAKKNYLAIVENIPLSPEADLVHFLEENKAKNKSFVFLSPKKETKHAELHYVLRGSSDRYHLLDIELKTGRHHQIRAQLAAIGCPIKGDVKYGARRANGNRSIHLHAWKLTFEHPILKQKIYLMADLPQDALWDFFTKSLNNDKITSGHF